MTVKLLLNFFKVYKQVKQIEMKKLYIALTAALLSATIQIQAQDTTKKEIDDKYAAAPLPTKSSILREP